MKLFLKIVLAGLYAPVILFSLLTILLIGIYAVTFYPLAKLVEAKLKSLETNSRPL